MKVFTTDKKIHQINELKSWVLMSSISIIFYWLLKLFTSVPSDSLIVGITVIFLLKLSNTFMQYRVAAIQINKENYKLNFRLHSLLSGEKIKSYDLRQATSELKEKKLWLTGLKPSLVLRIYLPGKQSFRISHRYGFSTGNLIAINNLFR